MLSCPRPARVQTRRLTKDHEFEAQISLSEVSWFIGRCELRTWRHSISCGPHANSGDRLLEQNEAFKYLEMARLTER